MKSLIPILRDRVEREFLHLSDTFSVKYSSIGGAVSMRVSFRDEKKRPSIIVELESYFVRLGMRKAERVAPFGVEVKDDRNRKHDYEFLLGNEPLHRALFKGQTIDVGGAPVQKTAMMTV